jgi:hypothetical protein
MNELKDNNHALFVIDAPKIVFCTDPVDLRFSIDGLVDLVMRDYKTDPKKTVFVFLNRLKNKIKVLAWHHNGFVLLYKKLEKKHKFFSVNNKKNNSVKITKEQLNYLIAGLDWITMNAFGELEYKYER